MTKYISEISTSGWFYYEGKRIAFFNEDESLHLCEMTLEAFGQTSTEYLWKKLYMRFVEYFGSILKLDEEREQLSKKCRQFL